MISHNALAAHEKAIQKRFPTVVIIPEDGIENECADSLCALGVPDDRRKEFVTFVIEELAPAIGAQGIELMAVMPYSQEEAEQFFPEACKATLV